MNHTRVLHTALFLLLANTAWGQAPASPAPPAADPPLKGSIPLVDVIGLLDGYYSFNSNHPASGFNTLRNFEVKSNQFSLNMAKLSLSHAPEPVGFTFDLGFGRAWQVFHATDPAGGGIVNYIPQAFVSLKPEKWGGLQ